MVVFVGIIFTSFMKFGQVTSRLKFGKTDTQMVSTPAFVKILTIKSLPSRWFALNITVFLQFTPCYINYNPFPARNTFEI